MNRDGNRLCLNFDPRTKILLLIELDIILFMGHSLIYETCVLFFCSLILAIGGQRKSAAKFLTVYMVFVVMQWFVDPYVEIFIFSLLHFITVCVRKLLPCIMLGKWLIATTEVSSFVAALWKMKIPRDVIITTSVMFRCFPTIKEEWESIQIAMKMRGIDLNMKRMVTSPVRTMEYLFVPLFISVLNVSDELAAAALCRGLDKPGHHTCMEPVCFRWFDYVFMMAATIWLFVMCALWIRGYAV